METYAKSKKSWTATPITKVWKNSSKFNDCEHLIINIISSYHQRTLSSGSASWENPHFLGSSSTPCFFLPWSSPSPTKLVPSPTIYPSWTVFPSIVRFRLRICNCFWSSWLLFWTPSSKIHSISTEFRFSFCIWPHSRDNSFPLPFGTFPSPCPWQRFAFPSGWGWIRVGWSFRFLFSCLRWCSSWRIFIFPWGWFFLPWRFFPPD